MPSINLHAHSKYSDGHASIAEMMVECRRLGHSACVITDHVYSKRDSDGEEIKDDPFTLTPGKVQRQRLEVAALRQLTDYPIILGIELSIKGYEEVCVFGTEAIDHIFELREDNSYITITDLFELRKNFNCAINLCHPMNAERFIGEGGHLVIDGYEYIHSGGRMFRKDEDDLYDKLGITKLCNSDAHAIAGLYRCSNVTEDAITTEEELIAYLREKRKIGFYVAPRKEEPRIINVVDGSDKEPDEIEETEESVP